MKVHLRFLRHAGTIQEALQNDGWRLGRDQDQSLFARHPEVADQGDARSRLQRLGLLTSSALHIEFREGAASGLARPLNR
jgi:hypothetical protein